LGGKRKARTVIREQSIRGKKGKARSLGGGVQKKLGGAKTTRNFSPQQGRKLWGGGHKTAATSRWYPGKREDGK